MTATAATIEASPIRPALAARARVERLLMGAGRAARCRVLRLLDPARATAPLSRAPKPLFETATGAARASRARARALLANVPAAAEMAA